MALTRQGIFKDADSLTNAMISNMREDTETLWKNVSSGFEEGISKSKEAWDSAASGLNDEQMVKDNKGIPTSGAIESAAMPGVIGSEKAWTGEFRAWHIPTLDKNTTPENPTGKSEIPIWFMMNWGSGKNWNAVSGLREIPRVGNVIVNNFGMRTRPLRTKITSRRTSRPPAASTESGFRWVSVSGFGDLKKGFLWPETPAKKLAKNLRERGIAATVSRDFPYFPATHFIEKSVVPLVKAVERTLGVTLSA